MSQLGWVNSRNKLEGQKKSPWNSGERKAKEMCLGVGGGGGEKGKGKAQMSSQEEERTHM